ncbi:MAG TPA: glycosyltransferase, partial [Polyangiales bacterium]|nr:glycosyltransferase [Polyangiales bacterium]
MKITYLFDRPLPANETDSEQAMHTIAALARAGADVTLVLPTPSDGALDVEGIRAHYLTRGDFRIVGAPQPVFGLGDARKWWHAAFARQRARGADVLYTRNFPTLFLAASSSQQPFCYETYRPWFDTFRPLAPAFRAALNRGLGAVLHS